MAELKPGGLALVISSEYPKENGRTVTLIKRIEDGEYYDFPDGGSYSYTSATEKKAWVVSGNVSLYEHKQSGGYSVFSANQLMPIDGDDFQHEDERHKELTHG